MISESSKRSLRQRKPPKSFDSDVRYFLQKNDDLDHYSNQKGFNRDLKNSSLQMNLDAKLLCRFINNVNKKYKQFIGQSTMKQVESNKNMFQTKQKKEKHMEMSIQNQKYKKQSKMQISKKSKEKYNFKINSNNIDNFYSQSSLNKIKLINNESANTMRQLQMSLSNQKYDNLFAGIKPTSLQFYKNQINKKLQNTKPHQTTNNSSNKGNFLIKDNAQLQKFNLIQQKNKFQKSQIKPKKPFARSSYHVAIAYHIYISKMCQKGYNNINFMNPIQPALKLRRQQQEAMNQ